MAKILHFLYNYLFIPIGLVYIKIYKLFNKKLAERELFKNNIFNDYKNLNISEDSQRIWFHAASMGEFEQAKPVIELMKKLKPEIKIFCSFFSPSGFNTQKNYEFADYIFYLPFDTKKNSKNLLNLIKPQAAVFVRYEIWHNYLQELKNRNIPTILINATIPSSRFIKNLPVLQEFTRLNFSSFSDIFTVGEIHSRYFRNLNIPSEILCHKDTRLDRIIENVEQAKLNPIIPKSIFASDEFVLVAGSTWEPDERLIIEAAKILKGNHNIIIRLILVPHEPTEKHIEKLKEILPESVLLSKIIDLTEDNMRIVLDSRNIIVDSIGKLLRLYSSASAAYIGGAFGVGVHSLLEPAGYGIPLFSGYKVFNSPDSVSLLESKALVRVKKPEELAECIISIIRNSEIRKNAGDAALSHVISGKGASFAVAQKILEYL